MDERIERALEASEEAAKLLETAHLNVLSYEQGAGLFALSLFQPEPGETFYPMPAPKQEMKPGEKRSNIQGASQEEIDARRKWLKEHGPIHLPRRLETESYDYRKVREFMNDSDGAAQRMEKMMGEEKT